MRNSSTSGRIAALATLALTILIATSSCHKGPTFVCGSDSCYVDSEYCFAGQDEGGCNPIPSDCLPTPDICSTEEQPLLCCISAVESDCYYCEQNAATGA